MHIDTTPELNSPLQRLIQNEIRDEGPLTFARFMELALYTPDLGYYAGNLTKLGPEGDFVTAPELSTLFSRCIAKQCEQIIKQIGGDILEFGAGTGQMAVGILTELERLGCLPDRYYIVEVSDNLRLRQKQLLSHFPTFVSRVVWLDQLPQNFTGTILANEVLDAFPVHRFVASENGFREYYVDFIENEFTWLVDQPQTRLANYLDQLKLSLAPGYISECNVFIFDWLKNITAILQQGIVLIIDYGFPRHEYYHSDRNQGTLMCYYRHQAHDNPLKLVGLQDITAHVDFSQVASAAMDSNLVLSGYTNQANFLLACGITDFLSADLSQTDYQKLANEIKVLTSPNEMGELFKVMALAKNYELPLLGFSLRDLRHRL